MYVVHGLGLKTTNTDTKPDSARSGGGYYTSKFENSYRVSVESQTLKFILCRVTLTLAGQKNTRHYMDTHSLLCQSKVLSSADHTLLPCGKKENNKVYKNEQKP